MKFLIFSFQREIIKNYAKLNNLKIKKEYVDDGYSGAISTRPAFNKMINDLEKFISINDNYDSLNKNEFQNSVDIRFKTLLYDFYSKDILNKVKSTSNKLKREGKFLFWSSPYGYIKDPNNKHKIIIDKETCETVKSIFKKFLISVEFICLGLFKDT